jgi:hypothetical protein
MDEWKDATSERYLQGEHPGCSQILYVDFSLLEDSSVNVSLIYVVETHRLSIIRLSRCNGVSLRDENKSPSTFIPNFREIHC